MQAKGIIIDSVDGLPMPGVVVLNLANKQGVATDETGAFAINDGIGQNLQLSITGYEKMQVIGTDAGMIYKMVPSGNVLGVVDAVSCYKKYYTRKDGACSFDKKEFFKQNIWWFLLALVLLILIILIIYKWQYLKERFS